MESRSPNIVIEPGDSRVPTWLSAGSRGMEAARPWPSTGRYSPSEPSRGISRSSTDWGGTGGDVGGGHGDAWGPLGALEDVGRLGGGEGLG